MKISKEQNESNLVMKIEERLDTTTAPILEEELNASLEGITNLVLDFEKLDYISSAGLRILLGAQKKMNKKGGSMVVKNVNETIDEVFEVTGFADILTIE